jgi:NADH-quinone oxidoreductase subunit E
MDAKEKLKEIFSNHYRKRDALIPLLQDIQEEFGYLAPEAMDAAARFCRVNPVEVYGVATFFAQFKFSPRGKNIVMVCQGTACHVMGGARVLQEVQTQLGVVPGQTTKDRVFTLERVACIGACALAPAMVVNKDTFGRMRAEKVTAILDGYRQGGTKLEIIAETSHAARSN